MVRERFGSQNLEKRRVSAGFLKLSSTKLAPRCGARAISKSSFKTGGVGALLEIEVPKICTALWRESDFERGGRRDFDALQNTWQAQEFVRAAKTLAGVVGLKRVRNDASRVAGRISWFAMSMFEAPGDESVEALQISCHGNVTLQCSDHFAWQLQEFVCLG